jgi:predicted Zn-dependent protease
MALLLGLSGCTSVPESGRSQLLLVSPAQEIDLGASEFRKLKQTTPISRDFRANAMLQRVGQRIAAVAPLPGARWEFVLFDQPGNANAFCLPGGKVGVYTGMLKIAQDEAGLAAVIGHEVAHAVAHHGAERMSRSMIVDMGGQLLDHALQTRSGGLRQGLRQAYGIGSQLGIMLPHSRQQELEADRLGLIYMARAGYDPRQAIDFWLRFSDYARRRGSQPLEFLSTHPLDNARMAQIQAFLPQAMAEYQRSRRVVR